MLSLQSPLAGLALIMHEGPTPLCYLDPASGSHLISPIRSPGLVHLHRPFQTPRCRQRYSSTIALAELPITGLGDSRKNLVSQSLGVFVICMGGSSVHNQVICYV
jgi:hypothetical protein